MDYALRLNLSCNKLHATRESWIAYRGWFVRATSCTLHSKWITFVMVDNTLSEKTHAKITALYFVPCVGWSWIVACNLLHEIGNAGKGLNNVPCVVRSCIKMHATRESWIAYRGWIIRATSCTLHSKWITLLTVDNMLFEKTHAKITALYFVPCVGWSWIVACNLLHEMNNVRDGG